MPCMVLRRSCISSFIVTRAKELYAISPIKEPIEAHLSIVGQRWPLEARPASPASHLDRFYINDAGGEPMSSRWSSWPACAAMTSVG